jgi:hypothetical protein
MVERLAEQTECSMEQTMVEKLVGSLGGLRVLSSVEQLAVSWVEKLVGSLEG